MIQNKNFTYNGVLNILQEFADKHYDIRRFIAEDEDQMSEMTSKNDAFPIMFVAPEVNTFDYQSNTFSMKVFVYDRLLKDRSNVTDLRSKTNQILNDLDVWLRKEADLPFEITSISTAYSFSSELMTDVTGWNFSITIDIPSYEVCSIPFISPPIISGFTCDIVYTNDYLTCDSLNDCPTTISILDSVEELSTEITQTNTNLLELTNIVEGIITTEIWTIELIDDLSVIFYAPYNLEFTLIDFIVNTAVVVIKINGTDYTLGDIINIGDTIEVIADSPTVINLDTVIL